MAVPESSPGRPEAASSARFFVDGHVDLPYLMVNRAPKSMLSEIDDAPFTLRRARDAGIKLFFSALYCEDRFNGDPAFAHFQELLDVTRKHYDQVDILKDISTLREAPEASDKVGTLFLLENADALADHLSFIDHLQENGVFVVGLTHIGANRLADGNGVRYSEGLTRRGKAVIHHLLENGLLVDVAHLHPQCFWELMRRSEAPVVSSHTGIRDIFDTPRNLTLEQVEEMAQRGGVVGITFNPEMLGPSGRASLQDVFAHLDTVVQRLGPDPVGIGSDFCGFDSITEGLEDVRGIADLLDILQAHGYPHHAVARIMGDNWVRVLRSLHPPA